MIRPLRLALEPLLSRRRSLLLPLAAVSCRSGERPTPAADTKSAPAPAPAAVELEVALVTPMRGDEQGGIVVVLLHGFGAAGDDLVPLARSLARPRVRFIVPAAPLSLPDGGRAWWRIDAPERPRYVTDDATPPRAGNSELDVARSAVQAVLRRAQQLYAPEQLFIAGFSQGAMLSLDVALAGAPPVERVAVLSGALLTDAAARLDTHGVPRPLLFISHGQEDQRLPFSGAERMKAVLEQHGLSVTWQPFHGGHEIPASVRAALQSFLFG
jgi:phospholipase/carboxylesterase